MTPHLCKCGKTIPAPSNSTIWPNKCPACAYRNAMKKKSDKQESSFRFKTNNFTKKVKSPRQKAMDNADKWFSRYIRLKYSLEYNQELFCRCYTCGALKSIKNIDLGHYVSRGEKSLRYDENNGRPQCKKCNRYRQGEHKKFHANLIKEIGSEEVDRLLQMSLFVGEDNEVFYKEMAELYRKKYNELSKTIGIKPFSHQYFKRSYSKVIID